MSTTGSPSPRGACLSDGVLRARRANGIANNRKLSQARTATKKRECSHFERTEPRLLFRPFEPLLHVPAGERRPQHLGDRQAGGTVTHEVLDLAAAGAVGHDQPIPTIRRLPRGTGALHDVHQMHTRRFHLPHHRTARRVLDPHLPPGLLREHRAVSAEVVHPPGRVGGAERATMRTGRPAPETLRDFADPPLAQGVQSEPEPRHLSVLLIKCHPGEPNTIAHRAGQLVQRDRPLRPERHVVRNVRRLATGPIVRPTLGQIQVTRQDTTERVGRIVVGIE